MNSFITGIAIVWMAFAIYMAARACITFYALLVNAQEELE